MKHWVQLLNITFIDHGINIHTNSSKSNFKKDCIKLGLQLFHTGSINYNVQLNALTLNAKTRETLVVFAICQ